ncbi:MAG: CIC family chloride channel protein [Paracrocinitomix sp.]
MTSLEAKASYDRAYMAQPPTPNDATTWRHRLRKTRDTGIESTSEGAEGIGRFLVYAALGVGVGVVVVGIEWLAIEQMLHALIDAPLWVQVLAPGVGLALTALILRLGWNTESSTSDAYVEAFHGSTELEPRRLGPKLAAALTTVGFGGAAGLEGPAVFAGANLGQWLGRRKLKVLGTRNHRLLLAAGAAAAVAAVFRAPATGVLFALETPFRRDIAKHALIPALVASAASYITFVIILGPGRLLFIQPAEVPLTDEVIGAVVIGLFAGIAARGIAALFHFAKDAGKVAPISVRLPVAAASLAAAVLITDQLVDIPVTLGPGAESIVDIVLNPTISVWVIMALFVIRAIASSVTLGAGGVGGVFIPLVVQGLLLGRIVEVIFDAPSNGLYPVIGLAAVLGAGYRTPLAAVMFVAETTGRAEFVIPALLATAVSQSLMGDVSVSTVQVDERGGQLEARLRMSTEQVTIPSSDTVARTKTLLEVIDEIDEKSGLGVIAVCDAEDGSYCGLLVLADIAPALMDHGMEAQVHLIMRDIPAVTQQTPALEAARAMNDYNTAAVAVLDAEGRPIGVVTATSIAGLNDLQ